MVACLFSLYEAVFFVTTRDEAQYSRVCFPLAGRQVPPYFSTSGPFLK